MGPRPRNLPLIVGIVASLALHVAAILPFFRSALAAETSPYDVSARFDPEDFSRPDVEEPLQDPPLGIDRPDQPPTMTWIGHREYREHLARLGEVEQAAFTPDAAVAGAPTPESIDGTGAAPVPRPESPAAPEPGREPEEAPAAPPEIVEQPELSPADVLVIESLFRALAEAPAPIGPRERPEPNDQAPPTEREADAETDIEDWLLEAVRDAIAAAERAEATRAAPSRPSAPAEPAPKSPPGTAPVAGAEPRPGEKADQESDATSIIEIPLDQLAPGQPLARQGLALHPRRPHFTNLVRVTAAAGNPLVEIRFAKTGKPSVASILESSGDARIDHAIEASLYRWRASGPPLEAIGEDELVDIRIRIILNRRAR